MYNKDRLIGEGDARLLRKQRESAMSKLFLNKGSRLFYGFELKPIRIVRIFKDKVSSFPKCSSTWYNYWYEWTHLKQKRLNYKG
ncbi:hypothetical protein AS29_018435 [Bacillus sp. SJS]|nr:hypothetical protein AS29_018435 [Bacillus sp. SJS]